MPGIMDSYCSRMVIVIQVVMVFIILTRTNWPRQVRELILDSDSWSQGVKGQAFRVPGGQG